MYTIVVSPVVLLHIPIRGKLNVVLVVSCYFIPWEDGDPGYQADDPTQHRMVDMFVRCVVEQEQMVGFVTQRPPELDNISELHGNIQHQVLG